MISKQKKINHEFYNYEHRMLLGENELFLFNTFCNQLSTICYGITPDSNTTLG